MVKKRFRIYLGPSLSVSEAKKIFSEAEFCAPIRRGDLDKIKNPKNFVIGIVDGVFHQSLAVSVIEVRMFLEKGGIVFGASSMGALRAAELRHMGMRGIGQIYEDYVAGKLNSDEDVALALHPETGEALTIPTVQVKYAIGEAKLAKLISEKSARAALAASLKIYYPERALKMLAKSWEDKLNREEIAALINILSDPAHDPKRLDAIALMNLMREFYANA